MMSVGGNVTPWALVLVLVIFVPVDTPGRVALMSSTLGFAVFAAVTEFPVIWATAKGATPLESLGRINRKLLVRNGFIGAAIGATLSAAL